MRAYYDLGLTIHIAEADRSQLKYTPLLKCPHEHRLRSCFPHFIF